MNDGKNDEVSELSSEVSELKKSKIVDSEGETESLNLLRERETGSKILHDKTLSVWLYLDKNCTSNKRQNKGNPREFSTW
jgi:hypothetical protein